jgi:hypothetical protein
VLHLGVKGLDDDDDDDDDECQRNSKSVPRTSNSLTVW